jgi:hypothetical protein
VDGGANVTVRLLLGGALEPADQVLVRDVRDGTYAVVYTVRTRGSYSLEVRVEGTQVQGSPFEAFFADATPGGAVALPLAQAAAMLGVPGASPCKDFQNGRCFRPDCRFSHVMPAGAALAGMGIGMGLGVGGVASIGTLALPSLPQHFEELGRTLHVGNLSPVVSVEQLKQLFAFVGTVVECRLAGDSKQFAFVEFATAAEAQQAMALNGMLIADKPLRIEVAKTVRLNKSSAQALPNIAWQHQMLAAQQAQQAASARVAAQAAASRAAEISRRLGGEGGSRERDRDRRRSRSRSRDRGERRRRSRSRSRERRR